MPPGMRTFVATLVIGQGLALWWMSGQYVPATSPGADPKATGPGAMSSFVWSADRPVGKFWGNDSKKVIGYGGPGIDGGKAIALQFDGPGWRGAGLNWKGWFPADACDDVSKFRSLVFHVRQITALADADLTVHLVDNKNRKQKSPVSNGLSVLTVGGLSRIDGEWRKVVLPLDKFVRNTELDLTRVWGIDFSNASGKALGFEIDRIGFSDDCPPIPKFPAGEAYSANATVRIDGPTHLIRDEIYGVCELPKEKIARYGIAAVRWGGNRSSRFNWKENADNAGKDWFFKNGGHKLDDPLSGGWPAFARERPGEYITVPTLGWVAKDHGSYGFSVKKYGPQQVVEMGHSDVGNGQRRDGTLIGDNEPGDTSIEASPKFMAEGVSAVVRATGRDPSRVWALDNEPMLWHETHRDVRKKPLGYDELWDRTVRYAEAIRLADPDAKIAGFCSWGWTDLFYSAADEGGDNYASLPDFAAHDRVPIAEWFIRKCGEYKKANGKRLIDVFDFHWYPQAMLEGRGPYQGTGMDLKFNQLRLRTTRDLWDPAYVNESWVTRTGDRKPTALLRRIRALIDKHNPGMEVCVGEYNFGGADNISGALAQAEVFGILGRERADRAFIWTHPEGTQELGWTLFRDFDGKGGRFGERSMLTESDNPDLAVFAAKRKDEATTIAIVNKNLTGACRVKLDARGLKGNVRVWRFDQETECKVVEVKDAVKIVDGTIELTVPAASGTVLVVE